jgi:hypothetical protein
MKIPFKRHNPADALKATEAALAETEAKILELGQARTAKLLETDGVDEVSAIDQQLEAQQRAAGIHRDRVIVLKAEVRRQAFERAEQERVARVAVTGKSLAERDAIGAKLETAIRDYGQSYFELIDKNLEISRLWGMSNNALRVGALGESIISREVSHALFAAGRPQNGKCRLPAPGTVGLGVIGMDASGTLSERIAGASAALLEMIKAVPVTQPEDEKAA